MPVKELRYATDATVEASLRIPDTTRNASQFIAKHNKRKTEVRVIVVFQEQPEPSLLALRMRNKLVMDLSPVCCKQ